MSDRDPFYRSGFAQFYDSLKSGPEQLYPNAAGERKWEFFGDKPDDHPWERTAEGHSSRPPSASRGATGPPLNFLFGLAVGLVAYALGTGVGIFVAAIPGLCAAITLRCVRRFLRGKLDIATPASKAMRAARSVSFAPVRDRLAEHVGCTPYFSKTGILQRLWHVLVRSKAGRLIRSVSGYQRAVGSFQPKRANPEPRDSAVTEEDPNGANIEQRATYGYTGWALGHAIDDLVHNLGLLRPQHFESKQAETAHAVALVAGKLLNVIDQLDKISIEIGQKRELCDFEARQRPEHAKLLRQLRQLVSLLIREPSGASPVRWEELDEQQALSALIEDDRGLTTAHAKFISASEGAMVNEHLRRFIVEVNRALHETYATDFKMVLQDEGLKALPGMVAQLRSVVLEGDDAAALNCCHGIMAVAWPAPTKAAGRQTDSHIAVSPREQLSGKILEILSRMARGFKEWSASVTAPGSLDDTLTVHSVFSRNTLGVAVNIIRIPGGDFAVGITSATALTHRIQMNQALGHSRVAKRWSSPGGRSTRVMPRFLSNPGYALRRLGRHIVPPIFFPRNAELVVTLDANRVDQDKLKVWAESFITALAKDGVRDQVFGRGRGRFNTSSGPIHELLLQPGAALNRMVCCNQSGLHLPAGLDLSACAEITSGLFLGTECNSIRAKRCA